MGNILDKHIRVSAKVKYALDRMRGSKSSSELIEEMIKYFEVTGYNPNRPDVDSIQKIGRRIEDLIKIVRAQEKDILRPLLDNKVITPTYQNNEQLVKLSNENSALKKEIMMLKSNVDNSGIDYKSKLESLVSLILNSCDTNKFDMIEGTNNYQVSASFFKLLTEKIKQEYVL